MDIKKDKQRYQFQESHKNSSHEEDKYIEIEIRNLIFMKKINREKLK